MYVKKVGGLNDWVKRTLSKITRIFSTFLMGSNQF